METKHLEIMKVLRMSEREVGPLAGTSHTTARRVLLGSKEGFFGQATRTKVLTAVEDEARNVQKNLAKLMGE